MMALHLISLLALTVSAPPEGGVYTLSTPAQSCEILLDATAAPLPETNLDQRDAAGFATAMPNCPDSVSLTSFWSYQDAEQTLSLYDPTGASLFSGVATEAGWRGEIGNGLPATLAER